MKTKIIYEDDNILVVHKPAGLATQTKNLGQQDVVSEIKNYLYTKRKQVRKQVGEQQPYIGLIHRLDQPVEGLILLAKDEITAAELSAQIAGNKIKKSYYAILCGRPEKLGGSLEDYILKDTKTNLSKIVAENQKDSKAKYAKLRYDCIGSVDKLIKIAEDRVQPFFTLTDIQLVTGRHHQIRVQFSHAGYPLLGDYKYGSLESKETSQKLGVKDIALCAYKLDFIHPKTNKHMQFQIKPDHFIFYNAKKSLKISII